MRDDHIYDALDTIFNDIFMRDDIKLDAKTSSKNIEGWDSLKMIEIIVAVEQHFGFTMLAEELDRLETIGDFVAAIQRGTAHG